MSYEISLAHTLRWEGGYVNDPHDAGGETYQGISRKHNPNWPGWAILDTLSPRHGQIYPQLTQSVMLYYRKHYWDKIQAGNINNTSVAGLFFDFYVHSGRNAVMTVQRLTGVPVDGIVGNKTIAAINAYGAPLFEKLKQARIEFLKTIPNNEKYITGWLNRVNSFQLK